METIRCTASHRERLPAQLLFGLAAVPGALITVLTLSQGLGLPQFLGAGLTDAFLFVVCALATRSRLGRTVLDEEGFTTRSLLTRRRVAWSEVLCLETKGGARGRGSTPYQLQAHRKTRNRRPTTLLGIIAADLSEASFHRNMAAARESLRRNGAAAARARDLI